MKFINALEEEYKPTSWLAFNDVLLLPQRSKFKSRNDPGINLSTNLGSGLNLFNNPIISANMDTVTGANMAKAMCKLGGLGILHRFYKNRDEYISEISDVVSHCAQVAFSVGCGPDWISFVKDMVIRFGQDIAGRLIVCLDVAHGGMDQSIDSVKELREIDHIHIIAGNVATGKSAVDLANAGANTIKVGVGSGGVCTTRIVTGHGVPQLSAIMNVRKALNNQGFDNVSIIADGGIKNSGDIVKSLAAGADAVMIGSLLAGCDETPGEIFNTQTGPFKIYRGQSSRHFLKDIGKFGVAAEGESTEVAAKGPTVDVVEELAGGIRSGLTYSGAKNIVELQEKAVFLEISQSGWVESTPHTLSRK